MLRIGLVSITFRPLSVREIISLSASAGVESIEWGGDAHVPHGDLETARKAGEATRSAGLSVSAYGSYYRFEDVLADSGPDGEDVLHTAAALGAPVVRLWAPRGGSAGFSPEAVRKVVARTQELAQLAAELHLDLAFEFHSNTLNDTAAATGRLLNAIDRPNVFTYWQPPQELNLDARRGSLEAVLPFLKNLHCFNWGPDGWHDRLPLEDGADEWLGYLRLAAPDPNASRSISLEYVRNDDPEELVGEVATLRRWINAIAG